MLWLGTAWNWLRANWRTYVWIPVCLLGVLLLDLLRRRPVVVDPVQKADQRAKKEEERRADAHQEAKAEVDAALHDLEKERAAYEREVDKKLARRVDALSRSPEQLLEEMRKVGKGEPL